MAVYVLALIKAVGRATHSMESKVAQVKCSPNSRIEPRKCGEKTSEIIGGFQNRLFPEVEY